MGTEARMKFLLSVSLILLFSSSTTSELLWNDDCTESSPFLIKNVSPNAKKPYLTLGVKTNSLTGGKLSKKGKPTKNQIWTWVNCGGGDFLSNKALGEGHTGLGFFLSINGKALNVVDFNGSPSAWIYDSELGTLRDVQSKKYVRLIKRKARIALTKKLKLMKKGPEKGKPWGWFRWTIEFVDSESGSGSNSGSGSGSGSGCVDCKTVNGTSCQFPFFAMGREYNTCTMDFYMDYTGQHGPMAPWCATKVDGVGNHLHLQDSSWGYCEESCATAYFDSTLVCPHSDPAFPEECTARHSNTHKNVLFLGNSYTGGCDGIDNVVRQIAEGAGFSATTERSSPGGKTLNWHAANSLDLIKNGDWDAVVLQDQSQRPSFGAWYAYREIIPDVMTLTETMREANVCTLPVFFQTWGKRDGDTQNCNPGEYPDLCTFEGVQDQLTEAYTTMAYVSQPSKVAPAGEAWRTYANRNSLFANDGSHATCSGTFLAACTIFQQIWGVPCSASTYSPVGDAAALKEQADAIVAAGADVGTAAEPWSWPNNGPPCPGCLNMAGR